MIENNEPYNSKNVNNGADADNFSAPTQKDNFDYSGFNNPYVYIGKKEIGKAAWLTGIPFIAVLLISGYWSNILFFFTDLFDVQREKLIEILSIPLFQDVTQIVLSMLMFLVPFFIAGKASKKSISELICFEKPKTKHKFLFFVVGFSFCLFSSILVGVAGDFFSQFGVKYSVNYGQSDSSVYGIVLAIISTAIVPGLVEEFACRGIVLGSLLQFGEAFAVITSAIMFGVMHGNFEQMPFAFLVGLVLGFIRVKTGSVWLCIIIHLSNNLFSVISGYVSKILPFEINYVCYTVFIVFVLLFGIFSWFILEKEEKLFSFDSGKMQIAEKNKYVWYFTSPIIIAAVLLYVFKSFRYFL